VVTKVKESLAAFWEAKQKLVTKSSPLWVGEAREIGQREGARGPWWKLEPEVQLVGQEGAGIMGAAMASRGTAQGWSIPLRRAWVSLLQQLGVSPCAGEGKSGQEDMHLVPWAP
jgi:hypothetical protein